MTPTKPRHALRLRAVMAKTGLGKTRIYAGLKAGTFPKPFGLMAGCRAVAWDAAEIDEHLERQIAARDTPKPALPEPSAPIKHKRRG